MNPLHRGILATLFGVVLGSLVSLAIGQVWALGGIIGGVLATGLSAYFFFDITKVAQAVSATRKSKVSWLSNRENRSHAATIIRASLLGVTITWTACALGIGLVHLIVCLLIGNFHEESIESIMVMLLPLSVTAFFVGISATSILLQISSQNPTSWKKFWQIFFWVNPVSAVTIVPLICIYTAIKFSPQWLGWIFTVFIPGIGKILKDVFIAIHCRDRMMCLVDSSFGIIAAFLIQQQFIGGGQLLSVASIIIGGIGGTVLFFFNRQVVALKWLKVQPNGHHA
ncbi:hypothetical protein IID19_04630 [Patescibacteria group bacterium]|nr:hypothetical protein [Patescibacteria group bacterium]